MLRRSAILVLLGVLAALAGSDGVQARPFAADLFCKTFPDSPSCIGNSIACTYCHQSIPPQLNAFGTAFRDAYYAKGQGFPESEFAFKDTTLAIQQLDSDQDGHTNLTEISAGTLPGSDQSRPRVEPCTAARALRKPLHNDSFKLCQYDHDYVYRKIWLDVCGEPPSFDDYKDFKALAAELKPAKIADTLDTCLDTNHWLGKNGVVWEIGHYKIRPVGSVKAGEDPGIIQIVDYYSDYNLFVYTQIDGHDARDVLLADYTVTRSANNGQTTYSRNAPQRLTDGQVMQPERRVGLVSSFWNLAFYLNYTAIARVLVAQAFNAFLGLNLSTMQGLAPPSTTESAFRDYDGKGVERPECAMCHTTIDPLAYPFRNYNGLSGTTQVLAGQNAQGLSAGKLGTEENFAPLSYSLPRMDFLDQKYPGIKEMPEAGYILGQRVENLRDWAKVLVNSDHFAANTVRDYWRVLVGHEPRPEEAREFTRLWRDFKTKHNFDVEAMLHDLIKTEAYGVP